MATRQQITKLAERIEQLAPRHVPSREGQLSIGASRATKPISWASPGTSSRSRNLRLSLRRGPRHDGSSQIRPRTRRPPSPMLPARRRVLRPARAYYKPGSLGMTREELAKLARSYAPQVIEALRDMAKNAKSQRAGVVTPLARCCRCVGSVWSDARSGDEYPLRYQSGGANSPISSAGFAATASLALNQRSATL